ncbi:hypothetical protein NDU88_008056 [Pleurodeles waltl]|uniref:Uncharacterized protein n=1 Tax=Pleurodeles waltl TaxID=8319 RepID=A0AAV7N3U4_PLEWA|nr:hypothetical protein NDU88_008056 [Pleurodeles waltl]
MLIVAVSTLCLSVVHPKNRESGTGPQAAGYHGPRQGPGLRHRKVHQALVTPRRPGAPPRAIIARILIYKDRDCILHAACEMDTARFENHRIFIYPDDTTRVLVSRKSQGLMLYVAVCSPMEHFVRGHIPFLDTPEDLWRWLEAWGKVPKERDGSWQVGTGSARRAHSRNWRSCEESVAG